MSVSMDVVNCKNWILKNIENDHFSHNEPLPSFYEVSRTLDISTDDVEKAVHELVTEQLLCERFQQGYFVKEDHLFDLPMNELISITEMIVSKGKTPGTIIISQDNEWPTYDDMRLLQMEDAEEIHVVERIRTADGEHVVYCLDKMKSNKPLDLHSANQSSLLELLNQNGHQLEYAISEIESIGYEPYISSVLQCEPNESLLLFKQIHYNAQDEPILYSLNYFKSSYVKFRIKRKIKKESK